MRFVGADASHPRDQLNLESRYLSLNSEQESDTIPRKGFMRVGIHPHPTGNGIINRFGCTNAGHVG